MTIGILKESSGDNRVSLLPEQVITLIGRNVDVWVEKGAGGQAFASDAAYESTGSKLAERSDVL